MANRCLLETDEARQHHLDGGDAGNVSGGNLSDSGLIHCGGVKLVHIFHSPRYDHLGPTDSCYSFNLMFSG